MPAGLFAGALVGVLARGWMRLLADSPEFSWTGTITVVAVFTVAGLGPGTAWAVRRVASRRRWVTAGRMVGAAFSLAMFAGAGAIMLPTVVGASLACWRHDWPRPLRAAALLVAVPMPLILTAGTVREGLSPARALGLILLALTYGGVVVAMGPIAAPLSDGWRARPMARTVATSPTYSSTAPVEAG